jgi:hypothetical protein
MKKLILYFLLFFFTLNPVMFFVMVEMHKIRVSMEIEKKRGSEHLMVLVIPDFDPTGSFHWKDRNEITYQGRFYDVVKQVRKNGYTLFYCYHDKKEETLVSSMKKLTGNKYLTFFLDDVVKLFSSGEIADHFIPNSEYKFPGFTELVNSITLADLSPPPEQS